MKKAFAGVSAYLAATMTAFAADLPARVPMPAAPVAVPVVFDWTGCYLGVEGGGNWGQSEQIARSSEMAGRTITGQFRFERRIFDLGCNTKTGNFVIGLANGRAGEQDQRQAYADLPGYIDLREMDRSASSALRLCLGQVHDLRHGRCGLGRDRCQCPRPGGPRRRDGFAKSGGLDSRSVAASGRPGLRRGAR